jgi:hypothetical protein
MEATSFFNQAYSVEEAAKEIQYYYDVVKKVNGEFITLFHNHFLTEQPQWIAWRNMYEDFSGKLFLALQEFLCRVQPVLFVCGGFGSRGKRRSA